MKDSRSFLLLLILLCALAGATVLPALAHVERATSEERLLPIADLVAAPAAADPATSLEQLETLSRQAFPPLAAESLGPVPLAPLNAAEPQVLAGCRQLLVNTALDVVVLDDEGSGIAEPWAPIIQNVYYDSAIYTSPEHSLLLVVGDEDYGLPVDDTPEVDAFAQAVYMPDRLTSVTIDYAVAMTNTYLVDHAYGSLYLVDETGTIDFDEGFIGGWEVSQVAELLQWYPRTVMITDTLSLRTMDDQRVALILWNQSDIPTRGEVVWFDDVMMTACWAEGPTANKAYLPAMTKPGQRGPICRPPSENPPDVWNVPSTRGYVEPSAVCNTTMSQLDPKDYYTFVAPQTRNYQFNLRDLPAGTEWSLTVFVDQQNSPPIADGGSCRTTQPGHGNKQVTCSLTAGQGYFIKVSAGSYSGPAAGYEMQITTP